MVATLLKISPFGPLLAKELRVMSRRKRTYFLRFLFLALVLLMLATIISSTSRYGDTDTSGVSLIQQQARIGGELFTAISVLCLMTAIVVAPILTSASINSERLGKTLPILLMTPMTAWQIAGGKVTSRLVTMWMFLLLTLPVLAIVFALGGVETRSVYVFLSLFAATSFSHAALGLVISCITQRGYSAILQIIGLLMVFYVASPLVASLLLWRLMRGGWSQEFWTGLWVVSNPVAAMIFSLPDAPTADRLGDWVWVAGVAFQLAVGLALLALAAVLIRRLGDKMNRAGGGYSSLPELPVAQVVGQSATSDSITPRPTTLQYAASGLTPNAMSRAVGDDPILWREIREPMLTGTWRRIVCAVLALLIGGSMYYSTWSELLRYDESHMVVALLGLGVMLLGGCIASAACVAHERDADTWELLLTTPLSGWQIVRGKLVGVSRSVVILFLLLATHLVFFTVFGPVSLLQTVIMLIIAATTTFLWLSIGMGLSLVCRSATTATVICLALLCGVYVVLPTVINIVTNDQISAVWLWHFHPIAQMDSTMRLNNDWTFYDNQRSHLSKLIIANTVVGLAGGAVLFGVVSWFDTLVGRAGVGRAGLRK